MTPTHVIATLLAWCAACGNDRAGVTRVPPESRTSDAVVIVLPRDAGALVNSAPADAPASAPAATLADSLAALRARELGAAADVIARRVAQTKPKMRLAESEAHAAALALLALADLTAIRELHRVMPRSTVELARAVHERGVSRSEAEAMATYLVAVVAALRFERLGVFDENHSHVIGREWHQIDYTGESMTWRSQRDDWTPKGVVDFRRAAYIHAYFVGAERLPHWLRVYKPRGTMADVAAPRSETR